MADTYQSLTELQRHHARGVDYDIEIEQIEGSAVAVIAPHGGRIEPTTSQLAAAIAADRFSYYSFKGLIPDSFALLHVTSPHFDEVSCLNLLAGCDRVVAVHGLKQGDGVTVLGGRDAALRDATAAALNEAGYETEIAEAGAYSALDPMNICNRGRSGRGVQLELPRFLRDRLRDNPGEMHSFAHAVQSALK